MFVGTQRRLEASAHAYQNSRRLANALLDELGGGEQREGILCIANAECCSVGGELEIVERGEELP